MFFRYLFWGVLLSPITEKKITFLKLHTHTHTCIYLKFFKSSTEGMFIDFRERTGKRARKTEGGGNNDVTEKH